MKQSRLAKYLILTFLISWVSWGALIVLINAGVTTYSGLAGSIFFFIGGWGPTIAAIAVLKKRLPKAILRFIFGSGDHRKSIACLLLFSLLLVATIWLSSEGTNPAASWLFFPINLLMMIFLMGGNEELGWRGTMQPILEKKISFPLATIVTSLVWSTWHLPLWFMAGSSQQNFPFVVFAAFGLVLSFAMAAIQKKSGAPIYAAIFHGLANSIMPYFVIGINWITVAGSIAIIATSLVIWLCNRHGERKNQK